MDKNTRENLRVWPGANFAQSKSAASNEERERESVEVFWQKIIVTNYQNVID